MKIQVKHKEINPIQHELKIEFVWDEVEKCIPDVLSDSVGTTNGYVTSADGEPFWVNHMQPTDENHIQYHGAFLEDKEFHTSVANQERGYFYRMGVRHYSPMLGRFLQKDPFTIGRAPNKMTPLSVNPYMYALNRPLQLRDITGYQPCPDCIDSVDSIDNAKNITSKDSIGCTVFMSRSCLEEGQDPDKCTEFCCTRESDPTWMSSCCSDANSLNLNPCTYTNEGECECGCCWPDGGGEENAPVMTGGNYGGGGHSGGGSFYGPPIKGPDGEGLFPWDIGPLPYQPSFPDRLPEICNIPVNSTKSGHFGSNIHNSVSQAGIGLSSTKYFGFRNVTMGFALPHVTTIIGSLFTWLCSNITKAYNALLDKKTAGEDYDPCREKLLSCLCSVCLGTIVFAVTWRLLMAIIGLIGGAAAGAAVGGIIVWGLLANFAIGGLLAIVCHLNN